MPATLTTYRNRGLFIALAATAVIGCGTSTHPSSAPPSSVIEETSSIPPSSVPTPSTVADSGSTPSPTVDGAFRSELQAELDATVAAGVPGAVVLSRIGDDTVTVAAGVSDTETGAPMTTDTKFRTGSVAKTFTATVALQLVDEGLLSLDDTVDKWLP